MLPFARLRLGWYRAETCGRRAESAAFNCLRSLGGHGPSMCDIEHVELIVFVPEVADSTSNFAPAPAPSGFQWKSGRVAPNVAPKRGSGAGIETREHFESEANAPTRFMLNVLAPGQVRR